MPLDHLVRPIELHSAQGVYLEGTHEGLVHAHHGSSIVKLSTVVGCREYCYKLPLGKELIAILNNLQSIHCHQKTQQTLHLYIALSLCQYGKTFTHHRMCVDGVWQHSTHFDSTCCTFDHVIMRHVVGNQCRHSRHKSVLQQLTDGLTAHPRSTLLAA